MKKMVLGMLFVSVTSMQAHAFRVNLGVVEVSDKGVEVRNPVEAVKETAKIVNPAEHVKAAAEIVEENTRDLGIVNDAAKTIAREAGNASETISEAAASTVEVTEATIKNPEKGLPRLMACSATACLSEVQAKRQAEEQLEDLRRQRQADLEKYKASKNSEEKGKIEASYKLVKEKLAETESQLEVFSDASNALINVEVALEGRSEMTEDAIAKIQSVSNAENQKLLRDYIVFTSELDSEGAGSAEFTAEGKRLSKNLEDAAATAALTTDEFLQRVSEGLNDSQAEEMLNIVSTAKAVVVEVQIFLEAEKQAYLAEKEAYEAVLGVK